MLLKKFQFKIWMGICIFLILIPIVLLILNGSFYFHQDILEAVGDQRLYYDLAKSIMKRVPDKSLYTLGYSLFYIPLIILTGLSKDWHSIMPLLIIIQSLILYPAIILLIFYRKEKSVAIKAFAFLVIYFFLNLFTSSDLLTKYTVFGLIPLSETLVTFLLLSAYALFFKILENKTLPKKKTIILVVILGFLAAFTLLIRTQLALLIAPIFIYLLIEKRFKFILLLCGATFVFYLPQLIWNYWVGGSIFFNGYLWYAEATKEQNLAMIKQVYNVESTSLFSLTYFKQNIINLIPSYILLLYALVEFRIFRTKFQKIFVIFALLYLIMCLSYWWSGFAGLIDRFLLPVYFLTVFIYTRSSKEQRSQITFVR